jgi:tetratricopeptide (TPR) repeat protein
MKLRPFSVLLTLFLLVLPAAADTIRLKNGTAITADRVTEQGDQVFYVLGATTYSIPRASVERIEPSGSFGVSVGTAPPGSAMPDPGFGSASSGSTAGPAPEPVRTKLAGASPGGTPIRGADHKALLARILNLNQVDPSALAAIEGEGNAQASAAAYFEAGRFEMEHNDNTAARKYLQQALSFVPKDPSLLSWYVMALVQDAQYAEAVTQAEEMAALAPTSADALKLLGLAYYDADRPGDAVRTWQRALALHPDDAALKQYLAKAERESAVEDNYRELESSHFNLRFEGRQPGFTFRSDLLRMLERQYGELQRDLEFTPPGSITVDLYSQKAFYDVTQAPAWAEAANDGKLRIPLGDVTAITPQMERVIKHELTHSFVHFMTHGRCPQWLNEGVAQLMEPRDMGPYGRALAQMFGAGRNAPLRSLEGPFTGFSPAQAQVAYAESLAAVEYLRSQYGMRAVRQILEALGEGQSPEEAVRSAIHYDYARLQEEVGSYLQQTYGVGSRN